MMPLEVCGICGYIAHATVGQRRVTDEELDSMRANGYEVMLRADGETVARRPGAADFNTAAFELHMKHKEIGA